MLRLLLSDCFLLSSPRNDETSLVSTWDLIPLKWTCICKHGTKELILKQDPDSLEWKLDRPFITRIQSNRSQDLAKWFHKACNTYPVKEKLDSVAVAFADVSARKLWNFWKYVFNISFINMETNCLHLITQFIR